MVKRLPVSRFWREVNLQFGYIPPSLFEDAQITAPWPDLLVTTGRTGVMGSVYVKKQSGGRTFTVQIQKPVLPLDRFDRVIVPTHDECSGDNVIRMIGSVHRITPALLREEAERWAPRFAHLPRPLVTVLLGGSKSAVSPLRRLSSYRLGSEEISALGAKLRAIAANDNAGILVSGSRRTNPERIAQITEELRDCPALVWDGTGDNPYHGMLGAADAFLVTCDSVNMICEAASTGKPVHMVTLPGRSEKMSAFHAAMLASGSVRMFRGAIEHWSYQPLREKERVAALVREGYLRRRDMP